MNRSKMDKKERINYKSIPYSILVHSILFVRLDLIVLYILFLLFLFPLFSPKRELSSYIIIIIIKLNIQQNRKEVLNVLW